MKSSSWFAVLGSVCAFGIAGCTTSGTVDDVAAPAPTQTVSIEDSGEATWELGDNRVTAESTSFEALVTRTSCSSGVTGEALPPQIRTSKTEIVVTFRVSPQDPDAANCPGNNQVPFTVELAEPIGERRIVDGECLPGSSSAQYAYCEDPVRWQP